MTFFYFSLFFISGIYVCAKCEFELFGSESKYGHHTPWPAFHATKHPNSLSKKMQDKYTFKVRQVIDAHLLSNVCQNRRNWRYDSIFLHSYITLTFLHYFDIPALFWHSYIILTFLHYFDKKVVKLCCYVFFSILFFYFLLQEFMFVWSVIILCFPHMPNTSIKPRGPPFPNPFEMIAWKKFASPNLKKVLIVMH